MDRQAIWNTIMNSISLKSDTINEKGELLMGLLPNGFGITNYAAHFQVSFHIENETFDPVLYDTELQIYYLPIYARFNESGSIEEMPITRTPQPFSFLSKPNIPSTEIDSDNISFYLVQILMGILDTTQLQTSKDAFLKSTEIFSNLVKNLYIIWLPSEGIEYVHASNTVIQPASVISYSLVQKEPLGIEIQSISWDFMQFLLLSSEITAIAQSMTNTISISQIAPIYRPIIAVAITSPIENPSRKELEYESSSSDSEQLIDFNSTVTTTSLFSISFQQKYLVGIRVVAKFQFENSNFSFQMYKDTIFSTKKENLYYYLRIWSSLQDAFTFGVQAKNLEIYNSTNNVQFYQRASFQRLDMQQLLPPEYTMACRAVYASANNINKFIFKTLSLNSVSSSLDMHMFRFLYAEPEEGIYFIQNRTTSMYIQLYNNELDEFALYTVGSKNLLPLESTYFNQRFIVKKVTRPTAIPTYSIQDYYSGFYLAVDQNNNNKLCGKAEMEEWQFRNVDDGRISLIALPLLLSGSLEYSSTVNPFSNELNATLFDQNSSNQAFLLTKDNTIPSSSFILQDGIFQIESALDGKLLDVSNGYYQVQTSNTALYHKFRIRNLGDNVISMQCYSLSEENINNPNAFFTSIFQVEQNADSSIQIRDIQGKYLTNIGNASALTFVNKNTSIEQKWFFYNDFSEGIYCIQHKGTLQYLQMPQHHIRELVEYNLGPQNTATSYYSQRFLLEKATNVGGPSYTIKDVYSQMYLIMSENGIYTHSLPTTTWKMRFSSIGLLLVAENFVFKAINIDNLWKLSKTTIDDTFQMSDDCMFSLIPDTSTTPFLIPNGYYLFQESTLSSAWDLDQGGYWEDNELILTTKRVDNDNQHWCIRNLGNNVVTIENVASSKFVYTLNTQTKLYNSSLQVKNQTRQLLWKVKSGLKFQNLMDNKVISATGTSPYLEVVDEQNIANEIWNLIPIVPFQYLKLDDGVYNVRNQNNKYLQIRTLSFQENTTYEFNIKNQSDTQNPRNQRFELKRIQDSNTKIPYYTIRDCCAFDKYVGFDQLTVCLTTTAIKWKLRMVDESLNIIALIPLTPGYAINFGISLNTLTLELDQSTLIIPDGIYYIQAEIFSVFNPKLSTNTVGFSPYTTEVENEMQWRVRNVGYNVVFIQNVFNSNYVYSIDNDSQLWLKQSFGLTNMWWRIEPGANKGMYYLRHHNNNTYITYTKTAADDYSPQPDFSPSPLYQFAFLKPANIIRSTFYLKSIFSSSYVELKDNILGENVEYILNSRNGNMLERPYRNQRFLIERVKDDTSSYTIKDCYSDLYLMVDTVSSKVCSTSSSNQYWKILITVTNTILLIFKSSTFSFCLIANQELKATRDFLKTLINDPLNGDDQYFALEETNFVPSVSNGEYYIQTIMGSKPVLGIKSGQELSNQGDVVFLNNTGEQRLKWRIRNLEDNIITLQNSNSQKFMYTMSGNDGFRQYDWGIALDPSIGRRTWFQLIYHTESGTYSIWSFFQGDVMQGNARINTISPRDPVPKPRVNGENEKFFFVPIPPPV